jgi:ethanolamine utilization protein EutA
LLAFELKKGISKLPYKVVKPSETIYATVIGAGVHTTELSGSTIYISDPKVLPLRNIPVFRIDNPYGSKNEIMEEVRRKMDTFKNAEGQIIPALLIPDLNNAKFDKIKNLAESIFAAYRITNQQGPLIVICEGDLGKALGSVLKNLCGSLYDVISIDEISVKEGDYIDIGEPLYNGSVVPVILKTLVFSH